MPMPACEIMNIASIGPRLLLAPAADPGDGLLDLVSLEPEARADMLAWLGASSSARRRSRYDGDAPLPSNGMTSGCTSAMRSPRHGSDPAPSRWC